MWVSIVLGIFVLSNILYFGRDVLKSLFVGIRAFFRAPGKLGAKRRVAKLESLKFKRDRAIFKAGVKADKYQALSKYKGVKSNVDLDEFIKNDFKVIKLNSKISKLNSKKVKKSKATKKLDKIVK